MIDHEPPDRRLLETATSRSLVAEAPQGEALQELRAAWLAMGRSLDAENADLREEALLMKLRGELAALPAVQLGASQAGNRERIWPAVLASAVALSLLMLVMFLAGRGPKPAGSGDGVAQWSPNVIQDAIAWTDAVDGDLDAALQRAANVGSQDSGVDDSLANLADHVQSLSDELSTSSL